jgi:dihydrofolate reductase
MSRTVYYVASSVDGFIADEHDGVEWLSGQDIDPKGPLGYDDFIKGVGTVVMGRTTYDWLRGQLRAGNAPWPYGVPAFVFTHSPAPIVKGADIRFTAGDIANVYPTVSDAAAGRDVWVVGGGDLAAQFADAGLLDAVLVSIAPVTLGAGRPLFPRRFDLELTEVERNRAFLCVSYSVVGGRSD